MTDGMEDLFAFLKARSEAEDKGEHEFVCPLCGEKAHWERSNYNGHLRAWCEKCDIKVMS